MFKNTCILILILLLATSVYSMRLVEPISKELGEDTFVGSIVPGQELELIISKELGKFNDLELYETLPNNFSISKEDYLEAIKIFISSNSLTPKTNYFLDLKLTGDNVVDQTRVYFTVEDSLLDATFLNYSNTSFVDNPASYELLLVNNSDADATFKTTVNLSNYWLDKAKDYSKVIVPKKSSKKVIVNILPQTPGENYFSTSVIMQNENLEKKFTLFVDAKPTLKSKFSAVLNGLPFYSISLLPSYLLNGLISLLF